MRGIVWERPIALYWKSGEVGIINDLCVYCGACVLSCMVDNCIKIERKREDGKVGHFSKPKDVIMLFVNLARAFSAPIFFSITF